MLKDLCQTMSLSHTWEGTDHPGFANSCWIGTLALSTAIFSFLTSLTFLLPLLVEFFTWYYHYCLVCVY